MIYHVELDDRDQTARAVLAFVRQIALTNKAIKLPVPLEQISPASSPRRVLGTMRGSFQLAADFTAPLDDLGDYM